MTTLETMGAAAKQAARFSNGGAIDIDRTAIKNTVNDGEILRICERNGQFIGLGRIDAEQRLIKMYKLFSMNRKKGD